MGERERCRIRKGTQARIWIRDACSAMQQLYDFSHVIWDWGLTYAYLVWCTYLIIFKKVIAILASLCNGESKTENILIIIYIHSPENCSALVWFWSSKNQGLASKNSFFKNSVTCLLFILTQGFPWYKTLESATSSLGIMSNFVHLITVAPLPGWLVWALVML